ncbi:HNH endonuclease [Actinotignum sp. GS-2025f]|uniref:HNH endonuclease n=1 Tax=Actinotignum TaxID=1653174 RepID=UPI0038998885
METRKTCEVCGMSRPEILEAAHIIPKHLDSSDSSDNGLLLCRNHHRAFDIGWLQYDAATATLRWKENCTPF